MDLDIVTTSRELIDITEVKFALEDRQMHCQFHGLTFVVAHVQARVTTFRDVAVGKHVVVVVRLACPLQEHRLLSERLATAEQEKASVEARCRQLEALLKEQEVVLAESRREVETLQARCQSLEKSSQEERVRKVGWELVANKDLERDAKEPRPATSQSVNSGTLVSFESAASQASLIYCSSANSLRSVAEWVFPLQNRILPPEKTYDRQLLAPSDPRRQWLEEYIQGSLMSHRKMYDSEEWCSPPQIEIIRISEVFNPIVNNAYYQQLSQMQEVWGTDRQAVPEMSRAIPIRTAWDRNRMNEVLLFHGCKWDSLFGILREGFDPRLGGINTGAAFGIGCYFTTVASKADAYTERWEEWEGRPNCEIPADLRCLLVARVALGEISELRDADASLRRPPCSTADVRCDSVLGVPRARGGCVDYDEFVIYKQAQATPQFIVDYKHIDCCTCRSSPKRPRHQPSCGCTADCGASLGRASGLQDRSAAAA
eukprot:s2069_g5.t2